MKNYAKNSRLREQRITTINLEKYQSDIIKSEKLNLSLLVRDLLKEYLEKNYSDKLIKSNEREEE